MPIFYGMRYSLGRKEGRRPVPAIGGGVVDWRAGFIPEVLHSKDQILE
jgi:hypothetical protein